MSSILDDPMVRKAIFPISVDFYHQASELGLIGEDVELLDGTLVKKMSKSSLHSWLVQLLFRLLDRQLPADLFLRKEEPLTFQTSEPEPDLAVVRRVDDDYRQAHPSTAELVIEVAISTVEVDRQKANLYAIAGVQEYWIVLPEANCVEVYREPEHGTYRQLIRVAAPARLASTAVRGFSVDLSHLLRP